MEKGEMWYFHQKELFFGLGISHLLGGEGNSTN